MLFLLVSMGISSASDDICSLGEEALYMSSLKLREFYEDKIKGWYFSGSGFVRDVRRSAYVQYPIVVVDCGNDVIVKVQSSSLGVEDLKPGERVDFSGKCIYMQRRSYSDTKRPYMHFELEDGSVK